MTESVVHGGQEVVGVGRIEGPIIFVKGTTNVGYDEVVEILDSNKRLRRGRVVEVGERIRGRPGLCGLHGAFDRWDAGPLPGWHPAHSRGRGDAGPGVRRTG